MTDKWNRLGLSREDWRSRLAAALRQWAFVILLAVMAARPFLGEYAFRTSAVGPALAAAEAGRPVPVQPDTSEISRLHFAMFLLVAVALWAVAGAAEGKLGVRFGSLGLLIIAFAVLSLLSALNASDKRTAINGWVVQVSILGAGFVAIQLCVDRKRLRQLVIVLAAVGGALAAKGLYQYFVEAPGRLADFDMYRPERLVQLGWAEGTPQAEMIRIRLADRAPFGYFSLANLFASLLIVLLAAAAGLAAGRIARAAGDLRRWKLTAAKGEVHLPTLAAILATLIAVAIGAVLVMTSSRGAMAAAAVAAVLAIVVVVFRRRLARHWRKAVLVGAVLAVIGSAAAVGYGVKYDRLPTKTMTYRWYYWTGAAQVIHDNPLLGVGPGNFHSAYLPYRRVEAEEEVKDPHNFILHALSQYGIAGGLCYLGAVAVVLVWLVRPALPRTQDEAEPVKRRRHWVVFLAVALGPLLARMAYARLPAPVALLETFLPVAVFWIMLAAIGWRGALPPKEASPESHALRAGLAIGLVGFVVHNLITYSLWAPATALVFWMGAGACLSGNTRGLAIRPGWFRFPAAAASVLLVAVVFVTIYVPVRARSLLCEAALQAIAGKDPNVAAQQAAKLGGSDPLDALSAADAARIISATMPRTYEARAGREAILRPDYWAREAARRDPANYTYWALAGRTAWLRAQPSFFVYAWRPIMGDLDGLAATLRAEAATRMDDPVLMSDLASVEYARGNFGQAAELLAHSVKIDPDAPALHVHLGNAAWRAGRIDQAHAAWAEAARLIAADVIDASAVDNFAEAVLLNPQNIRVRLDYARTLCNLGLYAESLAQLDRALAVDRLIPAGSVEHFTPAEMTKIAALRARVGRLLSVQLEEAEWRRGGYQRASSNG